MDAYQQAVEYLTAKPGFFGWRISWAWLNPNSARGGCLFKFVTPNGRYRRRESDGAKCGCLTMIRGVGTKWHASDESLTQLIRLDRRIPDLERVTVDHLPIFAGWQRRIDQVLGRTPPPLDPRLPAPTGDIEIPEPAAVLI